ncbi:MAG: hypothetical protein C3F11_05560 [Methylocystaceae bacterium]|nr:MAG: hypothetical protein C3F11_05560 [Methylocystaceae bacterium]
MSMRLSLAVVATLAAAGASSAAPRSIADCEAIQSADAYNRCLASFGPAAGGRARSSIAGVVPQRAYSHRVRGLGLEIERGHKRRARMVLTPGR